MGNKNLEDKSFRLLQWNPRSIRPKREELLHLIQATDCHLIALSETWLAPTQNFFIPGYSIYRNDRDSVGGGVAILVRHHISHYPVSLPPTTLEATAICVKIQGRSITVLSTYDNTGSAPISDYEALEHVCGRSFIIAGDVNAHHPHWGNGRTCTQGRKLEDWITSTSRSHVLNSGEPTYLHPYLGVSTTIDLTLSSTDLALDFTWEPLLLGTSDHHPILTTFLDVEVVNPVPKIFYRTKNVDWEPYSRALSQQLSSLDPVETTDPDTAGLNFVECVQQAAESTLPRSTRPTNSKPQVEWWTKDCATITAKLKKAKRRARRTGQPTDMRKVRELHALSRRTIKDAKEAYDIEFASSITSSTDLGKVWRFAKTGKSRGSAPLPSFVTHNGEYITDPATKSQMLGQSLFPVCPPTTSQNSFLTQIPYYEPAIILPYNQPFTRDELMKAISAGKHGAPGPDNITYSMIQNMDHSSLTRLLETYNLCWEKGTIPHSWKNATVIPIRKPGKPSNEPGSYRPIALNSCLLKVMERMVHSRLYWVLEHCGLLPNWQHGFRKSRGTIEAVAELKEECARARATKKYMAIVFLDVSKAFDGVWHEAILAKLRSHGFNGHLYSFIRDYLSERSYTVHVDEASSTIVPSNGVPQGGVLSPTLFELVINDLPANNPPRTKSSLFADDVTSRSSDRSLTTVLANMQSALDNMDAYGRTWGLVFNGSKSASMLISPFADCPESLDLQIAGQPIPLVSEYKTLGVWLDDKLSFKRHAMEIAKSAAKRLNVVRFLAGRLQGASRNCIRQVCIALVRSRLDYGSQFLVHAPSHVRKKLDSVQNKALRLIIGVPINTAIAAMEVEANIPPLQLRREMLYTSLLVKNSAKGGSLSSTLQKKPVYRHRRNKPNGMVAYFSTLRELEAKEIVQSTSPVSVISSIPPWSPAALPPNLTIRSDWLPDGKQSHTGAALLARFHEFHQALPCPDLSFFTDGSKTLEPSSCGIGIYESVSSSDFSARLPDHLPIFTVELMAIRASLQLHSVSAGQSVHIFSDSLSSLAAISNSSSTHPVVADIHFLCQSYHSVLMAWVPAHCGVRGNERADTLAKEALEFVDILVVETPLADTLQYIKHALHKKWTKQGAEGGKLLLFDK